MIKETKEQLQKKINAIVEREEKEMIAEYYPKFKLLEGKCFKEKQYYSSPEKQSDYWYSYTKITEINPEDIYDTHGRGVTSNYKGWSFQTDKYGDISIRNIDSGYVHSLKKEITEKEFLAAFHKMNEKVQSLIK